ncbi:MAG TPA: ABC transporter substrate-binding protein [Desulfosalsimonadaceae bacterium]|nr:ABC transporter substrate-binding protein [Desulfosalsimonadaceae bacterium]
MRCFISLWIVLAMMVCLISTPAFADEPQEVAGLLKNKIDSVLTVLENKDMPEAEKKKKIMAIVNPVIDFELMAKLTLGKTNWARLSQAEQEKFIELFVERLKASYLDKTTLYADQKVVYHPAVKKGNKIHVPVEVVTQEETAEVLYKFYSAGSQWRVYDVEINGVSLIRSYRSQFDEILRNGTVADLFEELKRAANE